MREFEYLAPHSLPEAINMLSSRSGQVSVLAGGTDLLLGMRAGKLAPEALLSLKRVPELRGIVFSDETGLQLGAMTTLRQIRRAPAIRQNYPSLATTADHMASAPVRSLATIGGNLCNASPAADLALPLIALDAQVRLIGPDGERQLALEAFFLGPGETALSPGELLAEILVPPSEGETIYLKQSSRAHMDIAVVGVAARLHLRQPAIQTARIVLGAVAPTPLRVRAAEQLLIGRPLNEDSITQAASLASEACSPISDVRGARWYRQRLVEVLVRRALPALGAQLS
jgi:carbon-monoxide dehydrogenase medium subunit